MSDWLLIVPSIAVLGLSSVIALVASAATNRPKTRRLGIFVAALNVVVASGLILLVAIG